MTIQANRLIEPLQHWMPVILPESAYTSWLNPKQNNLTSLHSILEHWNAEAIEAYPVSSLVNNPMNDREECIQAVT